MKKILLSVVALFAAFAMQAQTTVSGNITGAETNSILTSSARLYSLILANGGTNATTIRIIDAPSTALSWTNDTYIVTSYTSANVTNRFTNALGGYETNIFLNVLTSTSTTNAAATNAYATKLLYTVPASTTVSITPTAPYQLMNGLLVTNGTPGGTLVFTATYSK